MTWFIEIFKKIEEILSPHTRDFSRELGRLSDLTALSLA